MRKPLSKRNTSQFLTVAHLILPWLTPLEISVISSVNTTLHRLSKLITTARSSDATRSFETEPIPFINTLDPHPYAYFIYTPTQLPNTIISRQFWGPPSAPHLSQHLQGSAPNPNPNSNSQFDLSQGFGGGGCDCGVKCEIDGGCGCCVLGYGDGAGVVTECGPSCRCESGCGNRVTQKGVSAKLKIVRVANKGWGLFSDKFISSGKFVCEYAGEVLTTQETRRRQQSYDELAKGGQFYSALLVVREYLPSRKACFRINIDATTIGNAARFINHSCDGGNLTTVLIRRSGSVIPRVCFITTRDIQAGEELSFSYGDVRHQPQGVPCCCGSPSCFGILPSEPT